MKVLRSSRGTGKRRWIVIEELLKEICEVVLILRSVSEVFVHWVEAVKFEHCASPHASSGGELVRAAQRFVQQKMALKINNDGEARKLKLCNGRYMQIFLFTGNQELCK